MALVILLKAKTTVRAHTRRTKSGVVRVTLHNRTTKGAREVPAVSAHHGPKVVELFAGAGGLSYGLRLAGWRSQALVEYDKHAASTLRKMVAKGALHGEVVEGDARNVDFTKWRGADLVAGGPPCQPYSKGNMHRKGSDDSRDGFPMFLRAVEQVAPKYVLAENAPDVMTKRYAHTRKAISAQLRELGYESRWQLVKAVEHRVPQGRERTILMAWRHDQQPPAAMRKWRPRSADEGAIASGYGPIDLEALQPPVPSALRPEWLKKHPPQTPRGEAPAPTVVANHKSGGVHLIEVPDIEPGTQVRVWDDPADAIEDDEGLGWIPSVVVGMKDGKVLVRHYGRNLPPSRRGVVTAWDSHLVEAPTKKVMRASQALRRESQTFPPQWEFAGPKTAVDRQIGNAVPPTLGEALGWALRPGQRPPSRPHDESPAERYAHEVEAPAKSPEHRRVQQVLFRPPTR